ncbi:MAG: restriction endonuclease [Lachnospiraceae bacterium]|nr:restriction endonuclease [Lachnospiraceae bacterium]
MNGYEFEEYAARYLKRNGYSKVTVTKASRDFGVDLIAKKHRTTYAVQCKLYHGKVGNSAVQEAVAGKSYYDCDEAMVITNSVFYPGAITLAEANNVILIDGAQLNRHSFRWGRFFRVILLLLLCGLLIFCFISPEATLI